MEYGEAFTVPVDDNEDVLLLDKEVKEKLPLEEYDAYIYPDTVYYKRTLTDRFFSWPWTPWVSGVHINHQIMDTIDGEDVPYIFIPQLNRYICTKSSFKQLVQAFPDAKFTEVYMPEEVM